MINYEQLSDEELIRKLTEHRRDFFKFYDEVINDLIPDNIKNLLQTTFDSNEHIVSEFNNNEYMTDNIKVGIVLWIGMCYPRSHQGLMFDNLERCEYFYDLLMNKYNELDEFIKHVNNFKLIEQNKIFRLKFNNDSIIKIAWYDRTILYPFKTYMGNCTIIDSILDDYPDNIYEPFIPMYNRIFHESKKNYLQSFLIINKKD